MKFAQESGATIEFTDNPDEAVKGADVIYTDVWASMVRKIRLLRGRDCYNHIKSTKSS